MRALDGSYKQIFCKPTPVPPLPPPPPKPAPPPPAPPPPAPPPVQKPEPPPAKHDWCNIPPEPIEEKSAPKQPVPKPAPVAPPAPPPPKPAPPAPKPRPPPPPPKPRPPPPPPPFKENCRTIYGGCDGLKGWGVGRGKGWQYLDRLGGGVNKIAQCEGDEYLKGVGVSRCANNTNLRLKMTCCKGKRRVSGRNRDGNCPNAALGWGVGGGKGMQYLDRLGGRPGEKAMCSNNEMMVGLGVTRCANNKNLRLRLKCAERREVMQGALSGNKHTREQKCRTINASCPNAALGWGVGGGKGWQYLDRLGGTPGQIASCPNNQYLKGIGVKRCANAKNLHFTMTCCDQ